MTKTTTLAEELFEKIKSQPDPAAFLKAMADPAGPPTFESDYLDFKAKPDRDPKNVKLKEIWYEALSGFGNSGGGILVWGIDARKDPATGIDAACDVKPIQNPSAFKSLLIELQRGATDPPLGDVKIETWESSPGCGEGFIVCLIPSGPFKPYRAEISGKKQFFMRAVDSFYVPSVGVLPSLFYPQSRAVFELHWRMKVSLEPESFPDPPEKRLLTECELEVKNIGTATALPYVVIFSDPPCRNDRITQYSGWVERWRSSGKLTLESSSPVHPDSRFPLLILRWLTPASTGTSPQIRLALAFHAENQPRQVAEIILGAEPFDHEFERSGSETASDQEMGSLEAQFPMKGLQRGFDFKERQSLEKLLSEFSIEDKEAVRQLLKKGQMQLNDFAQLANEKKIGHVELNRLKIKAEKFLRHNTETGLFSIDPTYHDLLADLLRHS
jgi:hypothetical protein